MTKKEYAVWALIVLAVATFTAHIPFVLGAIGHYWDMQARYWGLIR